MYKCVFIAWLLFIAIAVNGYTESFLYVSSSQTQEELLNEIKELETLKIKIPHRFGNAFFLKGSSKLLSKKLAGKPGKLYSMLDGNVPVEIPGLIIDQLTRIGIEVWNKNYVEKEKNDPLTDKLKKNSKRPGPVRYRPLDIKPPSNARILSLPFGAGWNDTSEYLLHKVSVGIILMESTGHAEDWTSFERTKFVAETQSAMDWWVTQNPGANLSFVYDVNYGSTSHEPIQEDSNIYETVWIQEILTRAPFNYPTSANVWTNAYQYANDLRNKNNTDWAFMIFCADSTNDADKCFQDGGFAWAYLGGPWLMITYGNDGYGPNDLDLNIAHESGHIFYALDEYVEARETCNARSGYLNYENQNSRWGSCLIHLDCIMAETLFMSQSCLYTSGKVGIIDTDLDGIPDILDTFPSSVINKYLPNPTSDPTPTYTGTANVNPMPNSNVYGNKNDITLNTIELVQYRIDGGSWLNADPADALFNGPVENFTFTTSPLTNGIHTIEVRAKNSEGNFEQPPYPSDTLTIKTTTGTPTPSVPSETIYQGMILVLTMGFLVVFLCCCKH